ncbi:glycoside hydrolase family 3 N-terminal domain-containing protein [Arsenophonus sp.]|uniref:glycoside hydrolase family 3 N-terminal domain-containing protein n=1 Tax=Arsenophonus sp. TaxID=1872640 RepID=UPI00387943B3
MALSKYCTIKIFCVLLAFALSACTLPSKRQEESIEAISMKEKIGQMLIVGFDGFELEPNSPIALAIQNRQIGGVILFDYDFKKKSYQRNIKDPTQLKRLTAALQNMAKEADQYRSNSVESLYPLIIAVDYEGGAVDRLKSRYGFPKTYSAQQFSKLPAKQAEQQAENMAKTLVTSGINVNFSPVIDLLYGPETFIARKERSFSSIPEEVEENAQLLSRAYRKYGIACAYKHFPGHGSAVGDTHLGFVDVTDTWQKKELKPYQYLLAQKDACPIVMTAHVVNRNLDPSGKPATLSKTIIQGKLRDEMGFQGIVSTDCMQMGAIADNYRLGEALKLSINAGADMLIFSNQQFPVWQNPAAVIDLIYAHVKSGEIKPSRIESAYQRIIHLKNKLLHARPNITNITHTK